MEWLCFYGGRISCIMGKLLPLLILIQCIQCYTEFTKEQIKTIMHEYMLVCGPRYVCDPERFDPVLVSKLGSMQYKSKCPDCKCDDECMSRGDCCPDVVLSLPPLTCNGVTLITPAKRMPSNRRRHRVKQSKNRKPLFYFLVNSCPSYNINETQSRLCNKKYSVKERLLDTVVSSREFPVSFRNKFCAMCNGFTNLTGWMLDFDCKHFADFNFMSTYDSIIDLARKSQCTVKFSPGENKAKPCTLKPEEVKVGHCNQTGSWSQFNKDIQKACESLLMIQPYGIYRNVFCYMCNPSRSIDSIISTCNYTGGWHPLHAGLAMACRSYSSSETTKPFKNLFCFLCNKDNTKLDSTLLDASASIDFYYPARDGSVYATTLDIEVHKFNINYYAKNIHRSSTSIKTYGSISSYIKDSNPFDADGLFYPTDQTVKFTPYMMMKPGVNLTQLLRHVMAIKPENQICRKDLIQPEYLVYQNYLSPCQCDPSCLFGLKSYYSKCCMDTVLTTSMTCADAKDMFDLINLTPSYFDWKIDTPTVLPSMVPNSSVFSIRKNATKISNRRTRSLKQFTFTLRRKRNITTGKRKTKSPSGTHRRHTKRRAAKEYLVTNGCWGNKGHPYPRDRCNSHVSNDIFSILHLTDTLTNVQYFSYDCYLCNLRRWGIQEMTTFGDSILNDDFYRVWDIHIYCRGLLNFDHYLLLYDILRLLKLSKCTMRTTPTNDDINIEINGYKETTVLSRTYCESTQNQQTVHKCNETGQWVVSDPYITWACENTNQHTLLKYGRFKNVFCFLCNPTKRPNNVSDTIAECNKTGLWIKYDPNIERACKMFPLVTSHYPYKNWFCRACNENFVHMVTRRAEAKHRNHHKSQGHDDKDKRFPTFRSIFSLEIYNEDEQSPSYCDNGTFVGTEQRPCRPVQCFPGRILKNGICIPLLPFTNNLRYAMGFKLTIQEKILREQHNVSQLIKLLETSFKTFYENLLNAEPLLVEQLHVLANTPCQEKIDDTLEFLVHITMFVPGYIHRESSENLLSQRRTRILTVENDALTVTFNIVKSLEAMHVITILQNIDFLSSCSLQKIQNKTFIPKEEYRSIFVTHVLSCRQVELESDEFHVDWTEMSATILHLNRSFTYSEFHLSDGLKIRVCIMDVTKGLSHYLKVSSPEYSYLKHVLGHVTFACTVISLCCLFVTFITYCLFSKLRSIPGINNMNLTLALFSSQLCLQLGVQVPNESVYCIVTGIITHIFWLAVFSCMTMCSFHMYYVFAGSGSVSAVRHTVSIRSKRLWMYFSFAFILPLFIVLINVLITLLVDGKSPAYGDKVCFISNRISYIVAFLAPIVVSCCSNIYFFITTVSRMRSNVSNLGLNQERKNQFTIYVKLFMITGISWLLVIIDSFFVISALSFIAAFVNGLQGLFIFISYTCNRRVLNMYQATFCRFRYCKYPNDFSAKTISTDDVCHTITDSRSKELSETATNDISRIDDCNPVQEINLDTMDGRNNVTPISYHNATDDGIIYNKTYSHAATALENSDTLSNRTLSQMAGHPTKGVCNYSAIVYDKIHQEHPTGDIHVDHMENRCMVEEGDINCQTDKISDGADDKSKHDKIIGVSHNDTVKNKSHETVYPSGINPGEVSSFVNAIIHQAITTFKYNASSSGQRSDLEEDTENKNKVSDKDIGTIDKLSDKVKCVINRETSVNETGETTTIHKL